ncbi:MAG: GNAT family N-acetyltransferase [Bacteroidota bacterium]
MYTAKLILPGDKIAIDKIIDLRYDILRKPWDKPKETATDELEGQSINAYIEDQVKVIACGRLQNNGNGIGQIRYMAVDHNFQGKGLGKLILNKLEQEAQAIDIDTIELQARENALMFYKANGYTVKETSFKLWDIIQHYLMTKSIK